MREDKILIISGSRDWDDEWAIYNFLLQFDPCWTLVYHGNARGADLIADKWARYLGFPVCPFTAIWRPGGPGTPTDYGAGPKRNRKMADSAAQQMQYGVEVHCGLFPLPQSKGTRDMKNLAVERHFIIYELGRWA